LKKPYLTAFFMGALFSRYHLGMHMTPPAQPEVKKAPTAASQEDRELAEALRVQGMTQVRRGAWLTQVWGSLQRNTAAFYGRQPAHHPTARSFVTPEEKNKFDEAREPDFAVSHSVYAAQRLGK
jgi:hypothetical protein